MTNQELIAHPGYHVLRNIIDTLRDTGTYADEEGEATNHLADFAAALAREQEAQPVRYWSIADDANKCIHKAHCLATSKEMQALRLKALEEAQPAAQEPK